MQPPLYGWAASVCIQHNGGEGGVMPHPPLPPFIVIAWLPIKLGQSWNSSLLECPARKYNLHIAIDYPDEKADGYVK